MSRRIIQGQGSIDLNLGDKKDTYIRSCKTLEGVEGKNPSLFKVLIQNVECCILHGEPKDSKMQWFPNVVYIKTSPPEKHKQPQPNPTDPKLSPLPVDPPIGNLLKELSSQPLESLQKLLLGLQLVFIKREPGNPKPNNPNGSPHNNPNSSGNPPNPLKLNEIITDPDKLA